MAHISADTRDATLSAILISLTILAGIIHYGTLTLLDVVRKNRQGAIALSNYDDDEDDEVEPEQVLHLDEDKSDWLDPCAIEGPSESQPRFVKYQRAGAATLSIILVLLQIIRQTSRAMSEGPADSQGTDQIFYTIAASYTAILSLQACRLESHVLAFALSCHITLVSFISSIVLMVRMYLPSTSIEINVLGVTVALLFFTVGLLHSTLPRGPTQVSKEEPHLPLNDSTSSSIYNFMTMAFVTPLAIKGYRQGTLEEDQLPRLTSGYHSEKNYRDMKAAGAGRPGVKLLKVVLKCNAFWLSLQWTLAFVLCFNYYLPAYFIQKLLRFIEQYHAGEQVDIRWGFAYALAGWSSKMLQTIIEAQMWYISSSNLQTRIRVQLNNVIFAKTLRKKDIPEGAVDEEGSANPKMSIETKDKGSKKAEGEKEPAESGGGGRAAVLNLMTVDADRICEFFTWNFVLIQGPGEIIIGLTFAWYLLGVSALLGVLVLIVTIPLNKYAGEKFVRYQTKLMEVRDRRVGLMNEVLQSIRMIKMMAWESRFENRVHSVRVQELNNQRRLYLFDTLINLIWLGTPVLVTFTAFGFYTKVFGMPLTPSKAFTALAVFNELRMALNILPDVTISALQMMVSIRRIEAYLASEEVDLSLAKKQALAFIEQGQNGQKNGHAKGGSRAIMVKGLDATWPIDHDEKTNPLVTSPDVVSFALRDVNADFPLGELSVISGPTGSGKSLLLLSLLGESEILHGEIVGPRSPANALDEAKISNLGPHNWVQDHLCAYVPQQAWLRNESIRDNILFGLPMDRTRYNFTLQACALVADLAILEYGDETEIGEKGVSLSGGQKARVSLARAIYSRASTLFLDDVLSAVDAHTARHLYDECLLGPPCQGRTVILVSHHTQLVVPRSKYVLALENGSVEYVGPSEEYMRSPRFQEVGATEDEEDRDVKATTKPMMDKEMALRNEKEGISSESSSVFGMHDLDNVQPSDPPSKGPKKLIEDETRAIGQVGWHVYRRYMAEFGGPLFWLAVVLAFTINQGFVISEVWWLRTWSGSYTEQGGLKGRAHSVDFYLIIYVLICVANIATMGIRLLIVFFGSLRASRSLYRKMLRSIFRAPMRFYDVTPLGRLLNRFSKDFETIDSKLADNFAQFFSNGLSVLASLVTICFVEPWFLIAAIILAFVYALVARLYTGVSRELKRMESISRSPIYSRFGDAIGGVVVLRAFGASKRALQEMARDIDRNTRWYYWLWTTNRWMAVRFVLLGATISGLTGVLLVWNINAVDAALAGFAMSFAAEIDQSLFWAVRQYTTLELAMVSYERVREYEDTKQEPPALIEPRPPADWPSQGAIELRNLVVSYAKDLPPVLQNISFKISGGERIGFVGRTGSGKTTLANSFFRFVEPTSGSIIIDGIDIGSVGLFDLRSRLTIIPQDPTLLSGTLRSNLDPFDQHQDHDIFEALRRVQLLSEDEVDHAESSTGTSSPSTLVNSNVFKSLETSVSEGGRNFSQGQRQLLCLARALLKQSKIIILDEATASIDYKTDELVQKTIRSEFKNSTIICIAHRLRTIIDYSRILVMADGQAVEYGTPADLMADTQSRFYKMAASSGKREFATLLSMAQN